jgi:hypothetical protein
MPLQPQRTVLQYELRAPKDISDRAEMARRRLIQAYDDDGDVQVEAAARELVSLYPQSSLAYELRGRVAERAGRLGEAHVAYEAALALLVNRGDRLYLQHNPTVDVANTIESLSRSVARVRASQ